MKMNDVYDRISKIMRKMETMACRDDIKRAADAIDEALQIEYPQAVLARLQALEVELSNALTNLNHSGFKKPTTIK